MRKKIVLTKLMQLILIHETVYAKTFDTMTTNNRQILINNT